MIIGFIGNIGPWQLAICLIVAFVLFGGAKKIPELARSIGRAKGEFKKGIEESESAAKSEEKTKDPAKELV